MGNSSRQGVVGIGTPPEEDAGQCLRLGASQGSQGDGTPSARVNPEFAAEQPATERPGDDLVQLQNQAAQLRSQLRRKQRELDRREGQVNTYLAELDNEKRKTHLWVIECRAVIEGKRQQLEQQARRVQEQAAEATAKDEALEAERQKLHGEIRRREQQSLRRESELSALQHQLVQREQAVLDREKKLAERTRREEQWLATEWRKLAADREQINQLRRPPTTLDLRRESRRMHGETLEVRLATEQLWAELSNRADLPEMTARLEEIRSRVADHYEQIRQEIESRAARVQKLAATLDQRQREIEQQRQALASREQAFYQRRREQSSKQTPERAEKEGRFPDLGEQSGSQRAA